MNILRTWKVCNFDRSSYLPLLLNPELLLSDLPSTDFLLTTAKLLVECSSAPLAKVEVSLGQAVYILFEIAFFSSDVVGALRRLDER